MMCRKCGQAVPRPQNATHLTASSLIVAYLSMQQSHLPMLSKTSINHAIVSLTPCPLARCGHRSTPCHTRPRTELNAFSHAFSCFTLLVETRRDGTRAARTQDSRPRPLLARDALPASRVTARLAARSCTPVAPAASAELAAWRSGQVVLNARRADALRRRRLGAVGAAAGAAASTALLPLTCDVFLRGVAEGEAAGAPAMGGEARCDA
eukprot:261386-Chlamydomonas_euryale.AAC.5